MPLNSLPFLCISFFNFFLLRSVFSQPGAVQDGNITDENMNLLRSAIANDKYYAASTSDQRLCIKDVLSVKTQVVQGILYIFDVSGCIRKSAGNSWQCEEKECDFKTYQVKIWSRPWLQQENNNMELQVTEITSVLKKPEPVHEARLGGWQNTELTTEISDTLHNALSRKENYDNDVQYICVSKTQSVQQQIVQGINYKYHIIGCQRNIYGDSWQCKDGECAGQQLEVIIWSKPVLNGVNDLDRLRITSVSERQGPSTSQEVQGNISNEEKQKIREWIEANNLNKYGDAQDTIYSGATPLFNESTGESINLYSYIISRHPDRPWNGKEHKLNAIGINGSVDDTPSGFVIWFWLIAIVGCGFVIFYLRKSSQPSYTLGGRRYESLRESDT